MATTAKDLAKSAQFMAEMRIRNTKPLLRLIDRFKGQREIPNWHAVVNDFVYENPQFATISDRLIKAGGGEILGGDLGQKYGNLFRELCETVEDSYQADKDSEYAAQLKQHENERNARREKRGFKPDCEQVTGGTIRHNTDLISAEELGALHKKRCEIYDASVRNNLQSKPGERKNLFGDAYQNICDDFEIAKERWLRQNQNYRNVISEFVKPGVEKQDENLGDWMKIAFAANLAYESTYLIQDHQREKRDKNRSWEQQPF